VEDVEDCVKLGGGSAGGRRLSTEAQLRAGTVERQGAGSTVVNGQGAAKGTPHIDMVGANETEGLQTFKREAGREFPEDDGPNPWLSNL
jgi:hypothetical protein